MSRASELLYRLGMFEGDDDTDDDDDDENEYGDEDDQENGKSPFSKTMRNSDGTIKPNGGDVLNDKKR